MDICCYCVSLVINSILLVIVQGFILTIYGDCVVYCVDLLGVV